MSNEFGSAIRVIRENRNISMSCAAESLDVSVPYYSDIERGRRDPPVDGKLDRILDILGLRGEERIALKALAYRDRRRVTLVLDAEKSERSRCALLLGSMWDDISEETASRIAGILDPDGVSLILENRR